MAHESYTKYCTKSENVVYFKLSGYSLQDVNPVPNRNYDIEKIQQQFKKESMKVRKFGSALSKLLTKTTPDPECS